MTGLPKILMTLGAMIFVVGFLMQFIHIGRLPGDIIVKKGNTTVYFPIVTSILVSIILSAIFYFLGKFR
jgi:ribose/xylose/arabinose/galactoside ABC-type transport system permease subunit